MCGIAGIASLSDNKVKIDTLKRMMNVIRHRGPDDEGTYMSHTQHPRVKFKVGLGHKRLSIIDIEGGHQPMCNKDKTVWIVYNGEIYNFPELRERLIETGHKFTTESDTEVLLHLYEQKGIKCLEDLRGMFAFCIWDIEKERLFLARDRIGQKPLFYYYNNGVFIFASEIKAILEHDIVKRELDLESLDTYLTYGYTPSPFTMFNSIEKLQPAHYILCTKDTFEIDRYWDLSFSNKTRLGLPECEKALYDVLGEAVKMRLISDVPLGAFLSGGVDSSCIVALMSKLSSKKVRTFSIGFEEQGFDELKYARFISKRFNTDHKEFIVKPRALEVLPKLAWHYDQPFADSSSIPTYYVSKMTREHVTVALNGDGGDESFAGYRRYRGVKLACKIKKFPRSLLKAGYHAGRYSRYAKRFFSGLMNNGDLEGAYVEWLNYFTTGEKEKLYSKNVKSLLKKDRSVSYIKEVINECDAEDPVEKIMGADVKSYLAEDLLIKADIATMANSLEGRSPFLDHKVMEFAASLPIDYKLKGFNSKYILKRAFAKDLPSHFLNRRKKGFAVPVGKWFSNELSSFVKDMLLDKKSIDRGFFSKDYIENILREHTSGADDHTHRIYALLSFEMWHRIFIDRQGI